MEEGSKETGAIRLTTNLRLKGEGFDSSFIDVLPELENNLSIRLVGSILNRSLILFAIKSATAYPEDSNDILSFLKREGLDSSMSDEEKYFLTEQGINDEKLLIRFSWYSESLYVLLWVLGIATDKCLDSPYEEKTLSNKWLDLFPPPIEKLETLKSKVNLRDERRILEELDYYYHLHWIAKKPQKKKSLLRIFSSKESGKLNISVVRERRRALEWVCSDNDWNEVHMDT